MEGGVSKDLPVTAAAPVDAPLSPSWVLLTVLFLGLVGVFWVGVYPSPLLELIEAASRSILPGV